MRYWFQRHGGLGPRLIYAPTKDSDLEVALPPGTPPESDLYNVELPRIGETNVPLARDLISNAPWAYWCFSGRSVADLEAEFGAGCVRQTLTVTVSGEPIPPDTYLVRRYPSDVTTDPNAGGLD